MESNRNEELDIGVTASVASKQQLTNNSLRTSICIINTSTLGQTISIAIGAEAKVGKGFVLQPGGSWQDSAEGGYIPTQELITIISDAANATAALQERLN